MSTSEVVLVTQIQSESMIFIKTCKALQPSTRQRVVWMAALHRVCIENTLLVPSFPICDMSDLEIEKAAMGPSRWIELCSAFEKQDINGNGVLRLNPRATRIIKEVQDAIDLFIVPGGRYVVCRSPKSISVLDLGYTSSSDCKLIASVARPWDPYHLYEDFIVQATSDGMGLTIFVSSNNE